MIMRGVTQKSEIGLGGWGRWNACTTVMGSMVFICAMPLNDAKYAFSY